MNQSPRTNLPVHLHGIWCGHWAGNLGDSAAFDVIDRLLPESVGFTLESMETLDRRKRPQTQLISFTDQDRIRREIGECTAVLIAGTTIVTDIHEGDWPVVEIARQVRACAQAGRLVHAIGVGVYPGRHGKASQLLRDTIIPSVSSWTVRDRASVEALISHGADPARVQLAADPAWLLDRPVDLNAAHAQLVPLTQGRRFVAVNVVHEDWIGCDDFYSSLAAELDALHRQTGLMTVFFCNEIREGNRYDHAAARRVAGLMKSSCAVHPARWMHPEEMIARLALAEVVVSMRYHFSIFGILARTPVVAFGRGQKSLSLLEEFGIASVGAMGQPLQGRLIDAVSDALASRISRVAAQSHRAKQLQFRAAQIGHFIQPMLDRTPALPIEPEATIDAIRPRDTEPRSILVSRLDGLGDNILGTALLGSLRRQFPRAKIRVLVRPQMRGLAKILPADVETIELPFDPRAEFAGRESQIIEQLRAMVPAIRSDWAIAGEHNRVWAGEILLQASGAARKIAMGDVSGVNARHEFISRALGIGRMDWEIVAVDPLSREIEKYSRLLKHLHAPAVVAPGIELREVDLQRARDWYAQRQLPVGQMIIVFPGSGDGETRSLSNEHWQNWIAHLAAGGNRLIVLGSESDAAHVEHAAPIGVSKAIISADDTALLAGILKLCRAYIGMDTGPMHLAAVQDVPTLAIFGGGHRAHRFLPHGRRAVAIRMPISCFGCDWLCPFDRRLCIREIDLQALMSSGDQFLNSPPQRDDPLAGPDVNDIDAPPALKSSLAGAIAQHHRTILEFQHSVAEHHAYLAKVIDALSRRADGQDESIRQSQNALAEMTRQNAARDQAIAQLGQLMTELSTQNQARDHAINHLNTVDSEIARQNAARDEAIGHLNKIDDELARQNVSRDQAIAHVNSVLAEMSRHNASRDQAIADLAKMIESLRVSRPQQGV